MAVDTYPVADVEAARVLGTALRSVGYDEAGVIRLLGDEAYGNNPEDEVPVHERRLPETRLGTVVRLLFLELPISAEDAVRALGTRAVEALEATGLAAVGDEVQPRARIAPTGELLLASDRVAHDPRGERADHVSTYTPASHLCASLTPRPRVARALDVGTGNGIHALLASKHAQNVVATDVNERALAFTELNAALNGIENIECRSGSLFDPAEGETFDLITCNAPFVISPESRLTYRDAGFRGDEFSAELVRGAARHLAEGGYAALLASWLTTDERAPDARALAWVEESGCDAWVLAAYNWTPLDHAADWNAHLRGNPEAFGAVLDEWPRYLEELGASRVSEGAVILHRGSGTTRTVRVETIDADEIEAAGGQIERGFAARAALAELAKPSDLLEARLALTMPLRVEAELAPRQAAPVVTEARVLLAEGMEQELDAPAYALDLISELDGRDTLRECVDNVADRFELPDAETTELMREATALARELLEVGALRFAG